MNSMYSDNAVIEKNRNGYWNRCTYEIVVFTVKGALVRLEGIINKTKLKGEIKRGRQIVGGRKSNH